jgi:hypothetical protein
VTVHIGFANAGTALLASDSQASDEISEIHGLQKHFAGPDFLVGVAGLSLVLDELFPRLQDAIMPGANQLLAGGVRAFIEHFITQEVQPVARAEIEIIIVTPPDASEVVKESKTRVAK